jgi:hypothetical protein
VRVQCVHNEGMSRLALARSVTLGVRLEHQGTRSQRPRRPPPPGRPQRCRRVLPERGSPRATAASASRARRRSRIGVVRTSEPHGIRTGSEGSSARSEPSRGRRYRPTPRSRSSPDVVTLPGSRRPRDPVDAFTDDTADVRRRGPSAEATATGGHDIDRHFAFPAAYGTSACRPTPVETCD